MMVFRSPPLQIRRPLVVRIGPILWLWCCLSLSLPASAFVVSSSSSIPNRCLPLKSTAFPTSSLNLGQGLSNRDVEQELLIGRPFQLEEKEDHANCVTEIVLHSDHTITIGQSDGPLFQQAVGSWSFDQESFPSDVAFAMKLQRTYKAGYKGSDMGEFSFVVTRTFVGALTQVGHAVAVEGSIYNDGGDESEIFDGLRSGMGRVGFFSMIDTTPTKEEEENDEKQNPRPNFMMRTSTSF